MNNPDPEGNFYYTFSDNRGGNLIFHLFGLATESRNIHALQKSCIFYSGDMLLPPGHGSGNPAAFCSHAGCVGSFHAR